MCEDRDIAYAIVINGNEFLIDATPDKKHGILTTHRLSQCKLMSIDECNYYFDILKTRYYDCKFEQILLSIN